MSWAKRRGQVSFEYLLIITISLILITPLFIFYYNMIQDIRENANLNYLNILQNKIIDSAEEVYFQGFDAKKTIYAYIPANIERIEFNENQIIFYLRSQKGLEHILVRETYANVSGEINVSGTIKKITFEYQGGQVIVK